MDLPAQIPPDNSEEDVEIERGVLSSGDIAESLIVRRTEYTLAGRRTANLHLYYPTVCGHAQETIRKVFACRLCQRIFCTQSSCRFICAQCLSEVCLDHREWIQIEGRWYVFCLHCKTARDNATLLGQMKQLFKGIKIFGK